MDQKFNLESENVVKRRKPITESRDMTLFIKCGINPSIIGLGTLRVNIENLEFSVSCRWTFLHGNDEINIFWALLYKING